MYILQNMKPVEATAEEVAAWVFRGHSVIDQTDLDIHRVTTSFMPMAPFAPDGVQYFYHVVVEEEGASEFVGQYFSTTLGAAKNKHWEFVRRIREAKVAARETYRKQRLRASIVRIVKWVVAGVLAMVVGAAFWTVVTR